MSKHPNFAFALEHLPHGGSPVTWLGDSSLESEVTKHKFEQLVKHPEIQEQIREGQVFLGQSFGFAGARLLYDKGASQIRIAGGYDIDSDSLAEAIKAAVIDLSDEWARQTS